MRRAGLEKLAQVNAQALELFMHLSPEAESFLDCFTYGNNHSQIRLIYDQPKPTVEHIRLATACDQHAQLLFERMKAVFKKPIHQEPSMHQATEIDTSMQEYLTMRFTVNLDKRGLKNAILDFAAEFIEEHKADPHVQALLAQWGLDGHRVMAKDLEILLPSMLMLAEKCGERPQHNSGPIL